MTEKTTRLPVLMPRELLDAIDAFRFAHPHGSSPGVMSRAEAIRRLVETALDHQDEPPLAPTVTAPRSPPG